MSYCNFNSIMYKDMHLGEYGFSVWVISLGIVMFSCFLYIGLSAIMIRPPKGFENIIFFIIFICSISSVILWLLYQKVIAIKIIQEIQVSYEKIYIVTYFRRRINIPIHEIYSVITLEQNSFLLKKHRAVQTDKPCLQIKTKDNKNYLITPHMERFEELRATLIELVEQNKKLIHDKNKSTRL